MAARRNVTRDIDVEYDEHAVTITPPEREAAGVKAVMAALQRGLKFMGVFRTASLLPRLNPADRLRLPARRPWSVLQPGVTCRRRRC